MNRKPETMECVSCAKDAYAAVRESLEGLDHEELHAIYLDREHRLLETMRISTGDAESVVISPAAILEHALLLKAAAVVIAHNHPSGSPLPGRSDIVETERLKLACDLLGIILTDHIIVAGTRWYSFAEGMHPAR